MSDQTVIKFDLDVELGPWEPVPPEEIASGTPTQLGHLYFATDNDRFTCGTWDSTAYDEVKGPYGVDEFMLLLKGSLVMEQADGSKQTFKAGDGFLIPRGAVVQWQQSEYLRKFFFIYEDSNTETRANELGSMLIDPNAKLPAVTQQDPAQYESDIPEMGMLVSYKDPSGKFLAGVWDCSPMKRVATTLERSEFMHIIEGSGSITNADGVVFEFSAGDSFLIPVGMGYQWQNDSYVKKSFCSYTS